MPIASTSDSDVPTEAVPVLIVGARPVGLSLACLLSRQRIACRIMERDAGPTKQSRALLWGRALVIFDDDGLGILDWMLDRSRRVQGLNLFAEGRQLSQFELDPVVEDTLCPLLVTLPQGETERILVERLGNSDIEVGWKTTLTDLRATANGVTATVADPRWSPSDDQADWLVGCDSSRSLVRHELSINFEGSEYPETFLLDDLKIDWALPRSRAQAASSSKGANARPRRPVRLRLWAISYGTASPVGLRPGWSIDREQARTTRSVGKAPDDRTPRGTSTIGSLGRIFLDKA